MRRLCPPIPICWILATSAVPNLLNFITRAGGGSIIAVASATPFEALDNAILNDLVEAYATHEPSTCNTAASAAATSFSFDWPGANSQSNWFTSNVPLEQGMFQAIMSHNDATGNRSWSIRIGTGGNIYSHFAPDMHGETIPPQGLESPWVDEVIQSVAVNLQLNMNLSLPQYCPGPNINNNTQCKKYFIHQAGAYQRDGAYTTVPFHSPSLARHCSGNSCIFASWGTSAHVPTPFTSPIIYINKYTNCNNGIIEHTQMIHNFANPNDPLSIALNVDQTFFDVAWGGVRSSSLPYVLEPNPSTGTFKYGNVNDVDYLPICPWGNDAPGGSSGRAARTDLKNLGGYTSFVDGGLLVNQTFAPILPPCRKGSDPTCSNAATCMVLSCTDDQILNENYIRMELKVDAGSTPNCAYHSMWNGLVSLQCDMHDTGFGQSSPYLQGVHECYPWTDIGLVNSRTGEILNVAFIRHWSYSTGNKKMYFAVYSANTAAAINMVNTIFDNSGYASSLPINIVPMTKSLPRGTTQTTSRRLPLAEVPVGYDAAALNSFTIVYGKGQDYEGVALDGLSRRRIGSTSIGVGTRDYTVFTVNWYGNGARLQPGSTYVNRGFYFSSDLGSVQSMADDLLPKTVAEEIGLEQWSSRKVDIYKDGTNFVVLPATAAGGTSTTCGSSSASLICSGSSTPRSGYVPFFYVSCGSSSTYFGTNPYHFTSSFGSSFPGHGDITNLIRSYVCDASDISIRPTWRLMGFFNATNADCASIPTATYDATLCGPSTLSPTTAGPTLTPTASPTISPTAISISGAPTKINTTTSGPSASSAANFAPGCYAPYTIGKFYSVGSFVSASTVMQEDGVITTTTYNYQCSSEYWCSNSGFSPGSLYSNQAWTKESTACKGTAGTIPPTGSPTATSVGGCPSAWSANTKYMENDSVSVTISTTPLLQLVYNCRAWPYSGHCNQFSPIHPTGGKLGWEYVGGCDGTITPTSSPTFDPLTVIAGCPDYYSPALTTYHAGDRVTRTVSNTPLRQLVYQCNEFPKSLYCNVKAFAPGEQYDFMGWTLIGPCDGTLTPTTAPTAYTGNCSYVKVIGTTPTPIPILLWSATVQYEAGDQVRIGRQKFECKPWPYYLWCHLAAYKPTLEVAGLWTNAWTLAGACP